MKGFEQGGLVGEDPTVKMEVKVVLAEPRCQQPEMGQEKGLLPAKTRRQESIQFSEAQVLGLKWTREVSQPIPTTRCSLPAEPLKGHRGDKRCLSPSWEQPSGPGHRIQNPSDIVERLRHARHSPLDKPLCPVLTLCSIRTCHQQRLLAPQEKDLEGVPLRLQHHPVQDNVFNQDSNL